MLVNITIGGEPVFELGLRSPAFDELRACCDMGGLHDPGEWGGSKAGVDFDVHLTEEYVRINTGIRPSCQALLGPDCKVDFRETAQVTMCAALGWLSVLIVVASCARCLGNELPETHGSVTESCGIRAEGVGTDYGCSAQNWRTGLNR